MTASLNPKTRNKHPTLTFIAILEYVPVYYSSCAIWPYAFGARLGIAYFSSLLTQSYLVLAYLRHVADTKGWGPSLRLYIEPSLLMKLEAIQTDL